MLGNLFSIEYTYCKEIIKSLFEMFIPSCVSSWYININVITTAILHWMATELCNRIFKYDQKDYAMVKEQ